MLDINWLFLIVPISFVCGYFLCLYLIGIDPDVIRMPRDGILIQKPPPGKKVIYIDEFDAQRIMQLKPAEQHEARYLRYAREKNEVNKK